MLAIAKNYALNISAITIQCQLNYVNEHEYSITRYMLSKRLAIETQNHTDIE